MTYQSELFMQGLQLGIMLARGNAFTRAEIESTMEVSRATAKRMMHEIRRLENVELRWTKRNKLSQRGEVEVCLRALSNELASAKPSSVEESSSSSKAPLDGPTGLTSVPSDSSAS